MGKNRVEWIDLVRAIAILTVLYIHATDGIYIISSDAILNYTVFSRVFNFASLFIGRIGVPFFLMITGYLLLDRSYDDERVRKFWQKNCKGLIIVTVLWAVIYAISLQVIAVKYVSVNFGEAGTLFFSHMWYMPMIIGMYLSMPFVSEALEKFDSDTIWQATVVFSLLAFLLPFITLMFDMHGIPNVAVQYCLGFSGGVYGIYIILGYLVKKGQFKHYDSIKLGLIALISFMICLFFQYYAFTKGYNFQLWYEFPFVLTGSFALFELCSRMGKVRAYPIVSFLAKYSFAVFLVHNLFRLPLLPIVVQLPFTEPVKAIILWILLIIFSYIAVVIIYRIPRFGKFILYMR
ncbi:acyltransferase [Methanobrevibacter thaueri]|uniref:Acyltransferase family protein n=1 Tax=Methanobrevibacter thaueri TaxID=190975 RepID=A0A315XNR2_9EURY|nr:acyltransferase [Methanobrevibacter thaueri]PWB87975.1 acyltransferase family protein [Methanobrevibacter thaueri]